MTPIESETRIDPEEMREVASRFLADKVDRRAPWESRDSEQRLKSARSVIRSVSDGAADSKARTP